MPVSRRRVVGTWSSIPAAEHDSQLKWTPRMPRRTDAEAVTEAMRNQQLGSIEGRHVGYRRAGLGKHRSRNNRRRV